MTPSDLTGLSPLEAAARALEFVDQQNRGLAAKARELRAADRATTSSFEEWLCREMPPNTVIADPKWWASRIERAVLRAQTINGAARRGEIPPNLSGGALKVGNGEQTGVMGSREESGTGSNPAAAPPSASPEPVAANHVAIVRENIDYSETHGPLCAIVQWIFNPVPVGEVLSWQEQPGYTHPLEADALLREAMLAIDDCATDEGPEQFELNRARKSLDRIRVYLAREGK